MQISDARKELTKIQKQLKAPKSQFNSFGKYSYRNCEDILEAVKPLLGEATLTISDEIVLVGDRYYVKSIATFSIGDFSVQGVAYAREAADKKGMDDSQITGCASSYARKYALNGLFLIDDTKDADSHNGSGNGAPAEVKQAPEKPKATLAMSSEIARISDMLAKVSEDRKKAFYTWLGGRGKASVDELTVEEIKTVVKSLSTNKEKK